MEKLLIFKQKKGNRIRKTEIARKDTVVISYGISKDIKEDKKLEFSNEEKKLNSHNAKTLRCLLCPLAEKVQMQQ